MSRIWWHMHPCCVCGRPVECDGALEENYDGWPAVICEWYHQRSGGTWPVVCDACAPVDADEAVACDEVSR